MGLTDTLLLLAAEGEPPGLLPARQQMAFSLGWQIVLACFGVAFPTIIFVVHLRGIRRDDAMALGLAQRWAKVSAVLFAIGAVSGTVLSFEMGLLWPGLMGRFGDVLGMPFASVVTGWGVGQYPWLLVDEVTIDDAAGAHATLVGLLIVVALAAVIVLPALAYLLRLTQTEAWTRH